MFNRLRRELIPVVVRKWRELKNREAGRNDLWSIALSRHYVVCGQMAPGNLRTYVDRLEMMLVYYQRVLPSPRKPALDLVKNLLDRGGRKLLGRLWRISYDDFYNGSQVSEHYALSWALVHFLMNTRNPVYLKVWRRFMLEQPKRDRKSSKKLFEETLSPLDLDRLFADLTQYVRGGM